MFFIAPISSSAIPLGALDTKMQQSSFAYTQSKTHSLKNHSELCIPYKIKLLDIVKSYIQTIRTNIKIAKTLLSYYCRSHSFSLKIHNSFKKY